MKKVNAIYQFLIDGNGGAKDMDKNDVDNWKPEDGTLWLHFDYTSPDAIDWIQSSSGLDPMIAEALLMDETRPRCTTFGDGVLLTLRGVNMNPGSDPEDMVGIRLFIQNNKIISTRNRQLLSVVDIVERFKKQKGPVDAASFIVQLCSRIVDRIETVIDDIDDKVSLLEDGVLEETSNNLRSELLGIRRESIMLRRYLSPQREALNRLYNESLPWFSPHSKLLLREVSDKLIRHIEDLDSLKDRAAVAQEEIVNQLTEKMNNRMYVLSIVAAIFLPLGFLTGLLGINVGGIPGAEDKGAFYVFSSILVVIVLLQIIIFKKNKWF